MLKLTIIILLIILLIFYISYRENFSEFKRPKILFKAPAPLTKLSSSNNTDIQKNNNYIHLVYKDALFL